MSGKLRRHFVEDACQGCAKCAANLSAEYPPTDSFGNSVHLRCKLCCRSSHSASPQKFYAHAKYYLTSASHTTTRRAVGHEPPRDAIAFTTDLKYTSLPMTSRADGVPATHQRAD
eukprot:PhM_4_TR5236/c3_g1_i2/m.746